MKKILIAASLLSCVALSQEIGDSVRYAPERQSNFVTAFWLACDLIDESGYTAVNPLPSYDWATVKKNILPLMYWGDKNLTPDQKANIIAAIAAVKVLADEPGVDVSVVKPKP